jgi:hypothetical protein
MARILVKDIVCDVAILKNNFNYFVRYGVQVDVFDDLTEALDRFRDCVSHALSENFDV